MNTRNRHATWLVIAALLLVVCTLRVSNAKGGEKEFTGTTIDLGVVVSDIKKSVEFYTKSVGFTEVQGFQVPGGFCQDAGLTDGAMLDVHVLVLGEDESATKLKLMQLPGVKSKKSDNEHIHSQLGFSYITIRVTDTKAALARLKATGVAPVAKGPVELPKGFPQGVFLTIVRDPDGNLVELVGPQG